MNPLKKLQVFLPEGTPAGIQIAELTTRISWKNKAGKTLGELSLAKSLPRMLECLRHVQPNTAESLQCEVFETQTGWSITLDGEEEV